MLSKILQHKIPVQVLVHGLADVVARLEVEGQTGNDAQSAQAHHAFKGRVPAIGGEDRAVGGDHFQGCDGSTQVAVAVPGPMVCGGYGH